MCKKSKTTSQWSEIPPEILLKIGELTQNPLNYTQLRAVCNPWRSAFALVKNKVTNKFPLKVPCHPSLGGSLFIVPTITYMIQPTNGSFKGSTILVTVDEFNPGYVSPRYPLSDSNCGVGNLGIKIKRLDLLETRVFFSDPGFSLRELDDTKTELSLFRRQSSMKAIVLKSRCCENDLLVFVLCSDYYYSRKKLLALRVNTGEWKTVLDWESSKSGDVVKFKEGIYGIDYLGRAFFIDYDFENGDFNIVDVAPGVKGCSGRVKRLVVDSSSNGKLYMVVLVSQKTSFAFSVYGLNEEVGVWEKVKSIGDRMFFVGVNFSFCTTSRDLPRLARSCMRSEPRNCIFFRKGSFPRYHCNDKIGDDLLFDKNKEGTGMNIGQYYLGDKHATGILEPEFVIMFSQPI